MRNIATSTGLVRQSKRKEKDQRDRPRGETSEHDSSGIFSSLVIGIHNIANQTQ